MNDPLVITFGFDRRLFRHAIMAFWFASVPRPSTAYRIIFWIVVWLAALAWVITVGALHIPPVYAWGAAALAVGLFVIALQQIRMRRFYDAHGAHWSRTGDMTARFDDTGVTFTQTGTTMQFDWIAVDNVVRSRRATVFCIGMSMVTIPDAALPDGLDPRAFREKLRTWKAA